MEYKSKAKTEGTKQSRLTELKNGLTVTKGKETGEVGGKGERRGIRGITISTHNVVAGWAQGRQYNREDK